MLFEAFKKNRDERPGSPAFLVTVGDRYLPISWKRFTDDIDATAQIVRRFAPGAIIGIMGENSYEWMVVHAAILFTGATVTPVDANLQPVDIAERMRFLKARALLVSTLNEAKGREVAKLCPGLVVTGFASREVDAVMGAIEESLAEDPTQSLWHQEHLTFDTKQTSMLVFTSGTTSRPRGAELTVEAIETFSTAWTEALQFKAGDHSLMLLPLHHIFGVCTTYCMLAAGIALGICPDFRRIYDAFRRFRANFAFLVPALAEILAQKIQQNGSSAEKALGQPVDWILTGGAPLPRRTYEHLTSLGIKVLTGYGLTETCALYSVTPLVGDPHVGAQGALPRKPLVEAKVSEAGELLIRGPSVMKGYYKEPERTAKAIDPEGWYHTGDIGHIDEDGFVWITGRASRTIVLSSGKKIAPEYLEEKLLQLPGMLEAVVSGEGESREIRAEVYSALSEEGVRKGIAELNQTLPLYQRIRSIAVRKEPFPRTSSGKIKVG